MRKLKKILIVVLCAVTLLMSVGCRSSNEEFNLEDYPFNSLKGIIYDSLL